jgi:S-adenosylmethionine decarboxylase
MSITEQDKLLTSHFGEHITYDGYRGNYAALNCKATVQKAIADLVEALGMTVLSGPEVYFAKGNDKKDPGGWTGFVVIMESHISIHTFPARGFVSADVYTCRNGLNPDLIKQFFRARFKTEDEEVNFIKRGTRYPGHNIYQSPAA